MVCRENKARSAVMGYTKMMLARAGYASYADHEVQSMLHQERHRYDGFKQPSKLEYFAFLKGMRQQIVNDPSISDGDKYRPSTGRGGQPGLVTRLDEEMARFATGKTEGGKDLTSAQMNIGSDFAAMARLTQPLARAQEAKDAYCELYARQMGVTVDAARDRMRDLTDRPKGDRMNTSISLSDDWQNKLAIAGITAEQQSDMGQSNQVREALRIMEAERQTRVATYPTKPAFTPENTVKFVKPADVAGKEQCVGGCGQFGHTRNGCPNQQLVEGVRAAESKATAAEDQLRETDRRVTAAQHLHDLDNGQVPAGQSLTYDGVEYPDAANNNDLRAALEAAGPVPDKKTYKAQAMAVKNARKEAFAARAALDEATGTVPHVSNWLQSVSYNPDTGAMAVRTAPYTLKDGTERPGKTYVRQMPPDEYQRMLASGNFGDQISDTVFARSSVLENASDRYQFHNTDEARQATKLVQCPSCGQFASFGTGHQCPITGSRDATEQYHLDAQRRANREKAELAKLPAPPINPQTPRHRVLSQARITTPDNGVLVMPHPQEADRIVTNGHVAIGRMSASYLGANVTADTYTWTDPGTGQRLSRVAAVRCSCGQKECRHAAMTADTFARANRATPTTAEPGGRDLSGAHRAPTAHQPFSGDVARQSYSRIRKARAQRTENLARRASSYGPARVFAQSATLNGQPVDESSIPSQWSGAGKQVDLDNPQQIAEELRSHLAARSGDESMWSIAVDGVGGVWVRDNSAARSPRARSTQKAREAVSTVLGTSAGTRPGTRAEVYVPPMRSWRAEMLDRINGTNSGVRGARLVASANGPDAASI